MARLLIDNLTPYTTVTLRFHNSGHPYDEEALFTGIQLTDNDHTTREAIFVSADENGDSYVWHAYRYKNRWAYGTSAERLSLIGINDNTNIGD